MSQTENEKLIFKVIRVVFAAAEPEIRTVREEVFVQEQGVTLAEEWDGLDPDCVHVLARDANATPIGTGRLYQGNTLGRMAVRKPWRGHGVGDALLEALVELARGAGATEIKLWAQLQAIPFYERHKLMAHGPEFMDARIPHRKMSRKL